MKIDEKVFSAIACFLPHKLIAAKATEVQRLSQVFNATLLFADISGFTAMSERLARLGKEGAEEVNKIINSYFAPLIRIVYKWQGDIYRFGGDAFLAFFPEQSGAKSNEDAVNAGIEILKFIKTHARTKTKVGDFKIQIHIGLVKGKVFFQDLKNNFFLGGKVVNNLMAMIDLAGPGEIVVTSEVKKGIGHIAFESRDGCWRYAGMKRKKIASTIEGSKLPRPKGAKARVLTEYLPSWLLKRIELKPHFDHKDGEHRKIAVVFLHFSGIPYDKNPKKSTALLDNLYGIVNQTAAKYDGWINAIDIYKDSERVLAVFGFPKAYEDDEKRAVLFTYEIMNHPALKKLRFRAGINSGSIFAAPVGSELRREYATLGDSVNLAARLGAKAEPNAIVVSEPIFNKTFGLFDYEFLGEKEYKGKKKKIQTYRLIRKKQIEKKALTRWLSESDRIVGRNNELRKLEELVQACRSKNGKILEISGEPGIGKSRLVQELIKIAGRNDYHIFKGVCMSYGSAFSYHPWVDILIDFFGIQPDDTIKVRTAKIKEKSVTVDKKLADWLPVIGELMGVSFPETSLTKYLDAKIKKQRVFDIIFDFVKYVAQKKPVALIIEDLHWADSASMELVNYVGRNIQDKSVLFALVHRPLKKKEEFMDKEWTTGLALRELGPDEILELVKNLLNIRNVPDALKKIIVERSQGNPFYVEELIKSLIEQGYVVESKDTWKFEGDLRKLQLPDTLEAVILSRIDRLELQDRDVLQVASVLGREFDEFLLKGIYPENRVLKQSLNNLERLDLLKQQKGEGQVRYFFKHVLTQEVAYGTLSFARKQDLHRQTGTFIEEKFNDRKEEFLGLLSYHFFAGADYDRSLLYSVEAGEKAKKVYANEEAIEYFTRAIESYEKLENKQSY